MIYWKEKQNLISFTFFDTKLAQQKKFIQTHSFIHGFD